MPLSRRLLVSVMTLAGLAVGFVAFDHAFAQVGVKQLGVSAEEEANFEKITKGSYVLNEYITGAKPPTDTTVATKAARYYVFRVTWPSLLGKTAESGKVEPTEKALKEFTDSITGPGKILANKEKNAEFVKQYSKALVECFRELVDMPVVENSRSLLLGLQMLPVAAKLKTDVIQDFLLDLIDEKSKENSGDKKPRHDVVKLWAIRALGEYMPLDPYFDPLDPSLLQDKNKIARKKTDLRRVELLTKFIGRPTPSKASYEELEAFRFLRREAIETLAKAEAPAVGALGKFGTEGEVCTVLAKVILPGHYVPEPNVHEKVEAAIGLCNMKAIDKYEPKSAAYLIGTALIEFSKDYSNDQANVALGDKRSLPTTFPFKITAKRFEQALKAYAKNSPDGDKRAATLEKLGTQVTADIYAYRRIGEKNNNLAFDLTSEVEKWAPEKTLQMFKPTVKSSVIPVVGGK